MNIYIQFYCALHGIIISVLLLNVFLQFLRMKSVRLPMGQNIRAVLESDRNIERARIFLIRSAIGFIITILFQGFSFWLLWMGDAFEK